MNIIETRAVLNMVKKVRPNRRAWNLFFAVSFNFKQRTSRTNTKKVSSAIKEILRHKSKIIEQKGSNFVKFQLRMN